MPLPPARRIKEGLEYVTKAGSCERKVVYVNETIMILAGLTFVWGSVCFYPGPFEDYQGGCILFIIGSAVYLFKSVQNMMKQVRKHGWRRIHKDIEHYAEFSENVCYVAACLIFCIGCVLFWPGIYQGNETNKLRGEIIAAWCFIIGSLGFVIASFFNAILLSRTDTFKALPGAIGKKCYILGCYSLLCSQLGAVLFVSGSFMYRPGYNTHCDRNLEIHKRWKHLATGMNNGTVGSFDEALEVMADRMNRDSGVLEALIPEVEWCVNVMNDGTRLYIIGSLLYLVQSLIYLRITWIKQEAKDAKERGESEEDDESTSACDSEDLLNSEK